MDDFVEEVIQVPTFLAEEGFLDGIDQFLSGLGVAQIQSHFLGHILQILYFSELRDLYHKLKVTCRNHHYQHVYNQESVLSDDIEGLRAKRLKTAIFG